MSYQGDPLALGTTGLARFFEPHFAWLTLVFTIAADVCCAWLLGKPLVGLTLAHMDKNLPVGGVLLFFAVFALLMLMLKEIRLFFLNLSHSPVYNIREWFNRALHFNLSAEEYENDERNKRIAALARKEQERYHVSAVDLQTFVLLNDHHALNRILVESDEARNKNWWRELLIFAAGLLLLPSIWLDQTSLHALVLDKLSLNSWYSLVPALGLMIWGTFADHDTNVCVGEADSMIREFIKQRSGKPDEGQHPVEVLPSIRSR